MGLGFFFVSVVFDFYFSLLFMIFFFTLAACVLWVEFLWISAEYTISSEQSIQFPEGIEFEVPNRDSC